MQKAKLSGKVLRITNDQTNENEITMRYHLTSVTMSSMKMTKNNQTNKQLITRFYECIEECQEDSLPSEPPEKPSN